MTSIKKLEELNEFEQEKICHLLECNFDDLIRFSDEAEKVFNNTDNTYDTLMKILQQGNNVREATLIGILCGKLIGFAEAESKIEEDIKERLFNAFKHNRSL